MRTKAVFRTAQALNEVGIRALRFNFRGVGASTGSWAKGVGEREDARAALDWLSREAPDLPLIMGGFSFGSMVGLEVGAEDPRVGALVGLGLPVQHHDYSFLADVGKPVLVIQGENDEFGPEARIREAVEPLGHHVTLVVVPRSGHFFHDRFDELKAELRRFFTDGAGAPVLEKTDGAQAGGAPDREV